MICKTFADLPREYGCRKCGATKPVGEMVLVHRKRTHDFLLRPRCKECHNKAERGNRREYKTRYLRRWRRDHPELNESYWKQRTADLREQLTAKAARRFWGNHDALLIQGRLRRQLGMKVTISEARELARKYGCCYPTRHGLTAKGLRECERIRSATRHKGKPLRPVEIRMMVYEDGAEPPVTKRDGNTWPRFVIEPRLQKPPYQNAALKLREWWQREKAKSKSPPFENRAEMKMGHAA